MKVVLCVTDEEGRYRVTAYGWLNLDGKMLDEVLGQVIEFTLERDMGDFPFLDCPPRCAEGILTTIERRAFYEFKVVSGDGQKGWLIIGAFAPAQGCLPANA